MTTQTKTVKKLALPNSSMGNQRSLTVIRYGDPTDGPKAYIQAGLHADEPPGFVVMHHLIKRLDRTDAEQRVKGRIVLVPVANPIGVSQWRDEFLIGRFDFFNGINFNRNHIDLIEKVADRIKDRLEDTPGKNVTLIRETMADLLKKITPIDEAEFLKHRLLSLSFDADIVLDLHCDYESVMHVYMGTPLWPDAADLSAQLGAEATLLAKKSGGNPYDEACSRLWWDLAEKFPAAPIPNACLAATIELRGISDVTHAQAAKDADNIYRFLQRRGFIEGNAPDLPPLKHEATPLKGVEQVKAPATGVVVFLKKPGEQVDAGEAIAEIINPLETDTENQVIQVKNQAPGTIFSINLDRYARPGRILAKIAGKTPIEGKGENLLTL